MPTVIQPQANGPLKVEGEFKVLAKDGTELQHQGTVAYLCRCGASSKKPFCDSSHKKVEFKAE